jgi:hypothetical protein
MRETLRRLVEGRPPHEGLHLLREALQAQILGALQRAGAMVPMAFQGGTALRFLFNLPRFSEDLDFALVEGRDSSFALKEYLHGFDHDLRHADLAAEIAVNEKTTVHKAQLRFRGLAHVLGLSPHPNQTLMIRLEVDTRPPAGAGLQTTVVRRHELLHLQHHDQASLLAGKIHAVLARPYAKGRDYYDLVWYLSDPAWPPPNLTLLNNALAQTGWEGSPLTAATWRSTVLAKAQAADWPAIRSDVAPFLERPEELELLSLPVIEKLLESAPSRPSV